MLFLFATGYQLQIASCLWTGPCSLSFLSVETLSSLFLYWPCAYCHISVSLYVYYSYISKRDYFLVVVHHFYLSQFFCLFFNIYFWHLRGDIWLWYHSEDWVNQILLLSACCPIVGSCINFLPFIARSFCIESWLKFWSLGIVARYQVSFYHYALLVVQFYFYYSTQSVLMYLFLSSYLLRLYYNYNISPCPFLLPNPFVYSLLPFKFMISFFFPFSVKIGSCHCHVSHS